MTDEELISELMAAIADEGWADWAVRPDTRNIIPRPPRHWKDLTGTFLHRGLSWNQVPSPHISSIRGPLHHLLQAVASPALLRLYKQEPDTLKLLRCYSAVCNLVSP